MSSISELFAAALGRHREGRVAEAQALYRRVLEVDSQHVDAIHLLGVAAYQQGDFSSALSLISEAVQRFPENAEFLGNLGAVYQTLGDQRPAMECLQRAVEIEPRAVSPLSNLGNAYKEMGRLDEAADCYLRALAVDSNLALVHNNLAVVLTSQGNLNGAVAAYRRAIEIEPGLVRAHSNLLYTLYFCPGISAAELYREHCLWNERHAAPFSENGETHTNDRTVDRPLRIGYISADFRRHPVGLFILPLLQNHDESQFKTYCYASVATPDDWTDLCRSAVQNWRDVSRLDDDAVARQIRDDRIDILVDLSMHMPGNRLLVLARKPAPIQVTYLAYCGTTGLTAIDFRLTDRYLEPDVSTDKIYSETSIVLPETYWCYPDRGDEPFIGPLPFDRTGQMTFGCLNNFCKVTEPTVDAWVKILQLVPQSRLMLHSYEGEHRRRFINWLVEKGIACDRVEFIGYLPADEYLREYGKIDIALDPFPLGGGTTTCDALWMGVPVVTLAGNLAVGRGGFSILNNLKLMDLAAGSIDEYVEIAVSLASQIDRLRELRMTLRTRMRHSPLMDGSGFARQVETAYRTMWHNWCAEPSPE